MIDLETIKASPAPCGAVDVTLAIDGRNVAVHLDPAQIEDRDAVNALTSAAFINAFFAGVDVASYSDADDLVEALSDPSKTVDPDALFAKLDEELNSVDLPAEIRRLME